MLKFIKHNMETISGIEIYPVISLLIFFLFFVGLYVWVFTYKKEKITEMSNIPFNE
ncbi:CcoQ/FixQ family Cbb3-type cytochrome c oxidase assembly chaperone [Flavobacterium luminosum]|uniref:CcoQ/FixQ family Cbb3-type cytochrome c oxidase assembly chaperone n=1 Tax=Flavobacterium luminosum TaxID=2949086 RepID=A0ABT0TN02_9FLAO|nr:CcoQ/FixQ family Cbb3-type cytochrome c oxidase assembly chaperone [Flavobacterium sp. HXWNR70]MCL9808863.1 CcoQ/FixQ family Cbb3-type cytochrome c oxidase assembly chaperone [Flavobacterium sp. HXWNR70]